VIHRKIILAYRSSRHIIDHALIRGDRALEFQTFNAEYVERLAAGDPEIEARFSVYFNRFLSLKLKARRLPPGTSDDVRQETLYRVLKVLRQGKGLQDPTRFGAFVNSVCNNVLLELMHKAVRDTPPGDALPDIEDATVGADESLITSERKRAVERVLNALPPQDREILRLVFFEDLERPEICRRLGKDAAYLRVLLHRAKARFEAAFQKSFGHFACLALLLCNGIASALTTSQIDLWLRRSGWTTISP
jgi:RNA polymerase sigma-70 factor (ECF subfamily)